MTKFQMRPSRVLAKMRAGGVACGTKINLADPRVVEIAAASGFDCIWADLEHVPNTLHDIENQIRAAKMYNVDTLVRVPRGSYSDLIRPLEMDAAGIMVPHILSVADARQVAWQTKFHPVGRRPLDGGNSDGAYCQIPLADYLKQANEQRFVCIQIEDPEPVEHLDEIAQIPGIDMLFFGPADFSHGLGVPGQFDHPKIQEMLRLLPTVARRYGKFAGVTAVAKVPALIDMGYQFICVGADVLALGDYFGKLAEDFHRHTGPTPVNTIPQPSVYR